MAVYVDGVFTDQTFGIDGGLFDVERVEVARGPQGTTGGKSAIAGAINFHTRKPTEEFDIRTNLEVTDISTQRAQVAFGGPLGGTGFAYRLGLSSYTGDGRLKNLSGPDGMKPDELIVAPQLRWKNDRWDVNVKYQHMQDTGDAERVHTAWPGEHAGRVHPGSERRAVVRRPPHLRRGGLPAQSVLRRAAGPGGRRLLEHQPGRRPGSDEYYLRSGRTALGGGVQYPNREGQYGGELRIRRGVSLSDNLSLNYKFGWHDVINSNTNDGDQRDRVGGGVCPFNHPGVLAGVVSEGATDRICPRWRRRRSVQRRPGQLHLQFGTDQPRDHTGVQLRRATEFHRRRQHTNQRRTVCMATPQLLVRHR